MIHKNKKILTISAGCENQLFRGMKPGQEKKLVKRQGLETSFYQQEEMFENYSPSLTSQNTMHFLQR